LKFTDENIPNEIEWAINYGKWIVIENIDDVIPKSLETIVSPSLYVKGNNKYIKYNDKELLLSPDFNLFLLTTNPNPKFTPEVCVQVSIINFCVTYSGLSDQLLSYIVSLEKKELEEELNQLLELNNNNTKKLIEKEDYILDNLKNTNPEKILDEEEIITQLNNTKIESNKIIMTQNKTKERQNNIFNERSKYKELSMIFSLLFFSVNEMIKINWMYQ